MCPKGRATKHKLYHPGRIKYALKQTKTRGDMSDFIRISTEQALKEITGKYRKVHAKYGPAAIYNTYGGSSGYGGVYANCNLARQALTTYLGGVSATRSDYSYHQFYDGIALTGHPDLNGASANEPDITAAHKLIRADGRVLYGNAGCTGLDKRKETVKDEHLSKADYRINRRRSTLQKAAGGFLNAECDIERRKASVRSKVEHMFLIVKREFGYRKTVYRGLFKNRHRLSVLLASANLLMCARSGRTSELLSFTSS
jgi:IS5 family transposase